MISVFFTISQVSLLRDTITIGNMTYFNSNLRVVSDATPDQDSDRDDKTISLGFLNLKGQIETVLINGNKKEVDGLLYQLKCFGLPEHKEFWDSRS